MIENSETHNISIFVFFLALLLVIAIIIAAAVVIIADYRNKAKGIAPLEQEDDKLIL